VVSVASGSLPQGLTLGPLVLASSGISGTPTTAGRYEFALRVADACGASSTRSFTITIEGGGTAPVQISALPTSLAFQVERSNSAPPPTQSMALATATGAVGFSALGESEGNWLSVTPAGGFTPATLVASVSNYATLAPGTYTGRVAISSQAGRVLVPVTLTVGAAPAEITLSASNLTFTYVTGTAAALARQLINVNSASATPFTASAVTATGGTWLSATPSSGTAPANVEIAANPAGLAVGEYSGVVTFTPVNNSAAAKVVQVRLSVTAAPTLSVLPSTISIPYQQGGPAPAAQQINISSSGAPITFTATAAGGSWLSISAAQTTTPGLLQASFNPSGLAPGAYIGTITVQPTVGAPVVVNVTLTVTSPAMLLSAVTSAASFKADVVSPGELVTLFGSKFGAEGLTPYQLTAERRLDTTLAETRVLFDGVPAPLLYVSAEQISAIVPYNVSSASTTRVEVEYKGQRTNVLQVPVGLSSPALFTVGGTTKAAALNQDTSVNGYPAAAQVGSIVSLFATGAGTLAPAPADGEIVNSVTLPRALQDVGVTIAGRTAEVLYQGAAPGLPAGMLQVNVRIPAETPVGDVPVLLYVGGKSSPAGVTLSVR
jgi:uncharacterized protein (TIGR03437 family)